MIEWIIGAAVLGGLGSLLGNDKKRAQTGSRHAKSTTKKEPPKPPSIGCDSDFSEWRNEWEPSVNWREWIPKNRASEIAQKFPPFENGGSLEKPIAKSNASTILDSIARSRLNRCEEALRLEFSHHNSKFLKGQKEKLADFFYLGRT